MYIKYIIYNITKFYTGMSFVKNFVDVEEIVQWVSHFALHTINSSLIPGTGYGPSNPAKNDP